MSRFLCVFLPDFPARAAVQNDSTLRGRGVLVYEKWGTAHCDDAIARIVSASHRARRAGVVNGWPLRQAQAFLPDAAAITRASCGEANVWREMLRELLTVTRYLEDASCGLAFLQTDSPYDIVPFLRRSGAQAGVADDRATATLAAFTAVVGTLRQLKPARGDSFRDGVPVEVLAQAGISIETIQQLLELGWRYMGQMRSATRSQLDSFRESALLHYYAQSADNRPVTHYIPPHLPGVPTPPSQIKSLFLYPLEYSNRLFLPGMYQCADTI